MKNMFAQRMGLEEEKITQITGMSKQLKNKLRTIVKNFQLNQHQYIEEDRTGNRLKVLSSSLRHQIVMRYGFDDDSFAILNHAESNISEIKDKIFDNRKNAYDFIEYLLESDRTKSENIKQFNKILEEEKSGYRLGSDGLFVAITNENELVAIEEASNNPHKEVNTHITQATTHLSDRENPDYRNSIKESVSALEAMCRTITGKEKTTLGDALKQMKREGKIANDQLIDGWTKMYAYTNGGSGIRHAILGDDEISFDEAKFRLVSVSAFVNYLISLDIQKQEE